MGKYVLVLAVALLTYFFVTKNTVESKISETYYLTRDCQYQNGATGTGKGVMRTRVTSAQILSHQFGKEPYPSNLSCEVYLSTSSTDRFLVWFNHLYIPDVDHMCENVLHCFNTNTPISEGMQEAGGQTGLCKRSYPSQPLVTTAHYFTFTFRSKPDKLPAQMLADSSAGFRLTVTSVSIPDAKTRACPKTSASLSSASSSSLSTPADGGGSGGAGLLGADEAEQLRRCTFRRAAAPPLPPHSLPMSGLDSVKSGTSAASAAAAAGAGSASTSIVTMPLTTWCLPIEALCDGLANCPDSTDEQPICRRDVSLMSRLLSLGVAASVAMGVGAVALGMGCVLGLACCCYRALSSDPPPPASNAVMTTLHQSPGQTQHLLQQQQLQYQQQQQQRLILAARQQSPAPGVQRPNSGHQPQQPINSDFAGYAPNSSHYSLADSSGGISGRLHYQKPVSGYLQQQQQPQPQQRAYNSTEQLFGYGGQLYQQQLQQNPYQQQHGQYHHHHHHHQHQQAQSRLGQHHPPPASHHGGYGGGGGGGSRTPTSSRSAKSGRSGRSSYGPGHQIRPVPPPSRADSETGGHLQQQLPTGDGSRDRIVYPVQL